MKRFLTVSVSLIILLSLCWLAWIQAGLVINNSLKILPVVSRTHFVVPSFVDRQLVKMTLRQKVSSLLILHMPGKDTKSLKNYLDKYEPGGLIFMSDNIPDDLAQLATMTNEIQENRSFPYLFAVDEEGGIVKRLPDDIYPAAIDLKNQPANVTESSFAERSKLLHRVGLNLNFGIVADITDNPNSFIYPRVFGGDPIATGERVAAAVTASKGQTLSTLKHFPGHGESEADSHSAIPTTGISLIDWQLRDKPPFQSGIDAGTDVVMFGHLVYSSVDSLPATLSVKWHDILKNQLNFKGLVITDDMAMLQNSGHDQYLNPISNAVSALHAGNTMLLYVLGSDNSVAGVSIDAIIDGIVAAVDNNELSEKIINQDVRQVLTVRHSLANK